MKLQHSVQLCCEFPFLTLNRCQILLYLNFFISEVLFTILPVSKDVYKIRTYCHTTKSLLASIFS